MKDGSTDRGQLKLKGGQCSTKTVDGKTCSLDELPRWVDTRYRACHQARVQRGFIQEDPLRVRVPAIRVRPNLCLMADVSTGIKLGASSVVWTIGGLCKPRRQSYERSG